MKRYVIALLFIIVVGVLLFPMKAQTHDGATTTYTALLYKLVIWNEQVPENGYKSGMELYLVPNNFKDIDYYVENAGINLSNEPQRGTVIVFSNGTEYNTFQSSDIGNVIAESGSALQALQEKMETVIYAADFAVTIAGNPNAVQYVVYKEDFSPLDEGSAFAASLNLPSEPGIYVIRIQVSWPTKSGADAYDYLFKLDKK